LRFNHHLQPIDGKSPNLEMGSIVHQCLEYYFKSIINGMKKDEAIEYGYTAGVAYINSPEITNTSDEDRAWALQTYRDYQEYYRNDHWVPLEVEKVKGELVYEDDEIRIMWKAKFDLIADTNQGIYPVDHKTMKQRRDTINLNNQFTGQCLLMKVRTMFINKIGFQKSLKPNERFTRVPINFSFDRIEEWRTVILPYWAKMMLMYDETGFWPPNFTHCENKFGFCQFKEACTADRNMRETILGQYFKVGEPWDITND
jgi:CRISPR/Cas system-associated exonuclease Cas4 (RecB family)